VSADEWHSLSRAVVKIENKIRGRTGYLRVFCPAAGRRGGRRDGGGDECDADRGGGREGGRAWDGGGAVVAANAGGDDNAASRKATCGCRRITSLRSLPTTTKRGRAYAASPATASAAPAAATPTTTITTPAWRPPAPSALSVDALATTAGATWCVHDPSRWTWSSLYYGWACPWACLARRRGRTRKGGGEGGRREGGRGRWKGGRRDVYYEGGAFFEFGRTGWRTVAYVAASAAAAAAAAAARRGGRGTAAVAGTVLPAAAAASAASATTAAAATGRVCEASRSAPSVLRGRAGSVGRRRRRRRTGRREHASLTATGREGRVGWRRRRRTRRRGDPYAWVHGIEAIVAAGDADSRRRRRRKGGGDGGRTKRV